METRRGLRWTIASLVVFALLFLLVDGTLQIRARRERDWIAIGTRATLLRAEAAKEQVPRVALRRPLDSGNAWHWYAAALREFYEAYPHGDLEEFLFNGRSADPVQFHQWRADLDFIREDIQRAAASLMLLRLGALRPTAHFIPINWYQRGGIRYLASLGVCQARLLHEDGASAEALDILLDVAQLGLDCVVGIEGEGASTALDILNIVLEELRDLIVSGSLGPEERRVLAAALANLDRGFPLELAARKEYVGWLGNWLIGEGVPPCNPGGGVSKAMFMDVGLRHLYSERQYKIDAFDQWCRAYFQSEPMERRDPNEVVSAGYLNLERVGYSRQCLTKIRLLRAALGEEPSALADPYGGRLQSTPSATGLRVWSVGANGKDDGGVGLWVRPASRDKPFDGLDIVLEAKR